MGLTASCFSGPSVDRELRHAVETGDVATVLATVRDRPHLLHARVFPGQNTLIHVVARYGRAEVLAALLALRNDLASPDAGQLSSVDLGAGGGRDGGILTSTSSLSLAGPAAYAADSSIPRAVSFLGSLYGSMERRSSALHGDSFSSRLRDERAAGAGPWGLPEARTLVNLTNARKQTPLIIAASRGHPEVVSLLIEMGADLYVADKAEHCTALHYAAMYGHVGCVKALLVGDAAVAAAAMAPDGGTPTAGRGPRAQIRLIVRGVHASAASVLPLRSAGSASFSSASASSPPPPIPALPPGPEEGGQDDAPRTASDAQDAIDGIDGPRPSDMGRRPVSRLVDQVGYAGATALHFACDAGNVEVVRLLCVYGADINRVVRPIRFRWMSLQQGATPLHLAAEQGHLSVALVLLKHYMLTAHALPGVVDPRVQLDAAGLRPHQLAFLMHHFRTALITRPGYPLRWLFEGPPAAVTRQVVPRLASLAAQALRAQLCSEIDGLEAAAALRGAAELPPAAAANVAPGPAGRAAAKASMMPGHELEVAASPALPRGAATQAGAAPQPTAGAGEGTGRDGGVGSLLPRPATHIDDDDDDDDGDQGKGCPICWEEDKAGLMLTPCGHGMCISCARQMCAAISTRPISCPLCRTIVRGFGMPLHANRRGVHHHHHHHGGSHGKLGPGGAGEPVAPGAAVAAE